MQRRVKSRSLLLVALAGTALIAGCSGSAPRLALYEVDASSRAM